LILDCFLCLAIYIMEFETILFFVLVIALCCICYHFGGMIKRLTIGGTNADQHVIMVVGSGGVGKSTFVKNFIRNNPKYTPIHLDSLIDNLGLSHTKVYKWGPITDDGVKLVDAIRKKLIIANYVIIEGSMWNIDTIKLINPDELIYISPKSKNELKRRLMNRIRNDPGDKHRVGLIRSLDTDGQALFQLRKKKNIGPIREIIHRASTKIMENEYNHFNTYKEFFPGVVLATV
jgi:septin family protein